MQYFNVTTASNSHFKWLVDISSSIFSATLAVLNANPSNIRRESLILLSITQVKPRDLAAIIAGFSVWVWWSVSCMPSITIRLPNAVLRPTCQTGFISPFIAYAVIISFNLSIAWRSISLDIFNPNPLLNYAANKFMPDKFWLIVASNCTWFCLLILQLIVSAKFLLYFYIKKMQLIIITIIISEIIHTYSNELCVNFIEHRDIYSGFAQI